MNLGITSELVALRARVAQLEQIVFGQATRLCPVCGAAVFGRADKIHCGDYHRALSARRRRRGLHPGGCAPDGSVVCDRVPDCGATNEPPTMGVWK